MAKSLGPLSALRATCLSLLGAAQTRLELLGNEIQIEKRHALQQLSLAVLAIFSLGMALLLAVGLLLVLLWEQRVLVLSLLIILFLALAGGLYLMLRRASEKAEPLFSSSLAELKKDLHQLKAASADEQRPESAAR